MVVLVLMHVQVAANAQNPKTEKPKRTDSSIWENEPVTFDQADEDKDGIINAEDACPGIAGTKANKGCPGNAKTSTEFISKDAFETIIEATCNKKLETYRDKNNLAGGNAMLATTLPKTGKHKEFTVYYQTDGKGSFISIITLSNNINDNRDAAVYITELMNKTDSWCLQKREKSIYKSANGDSTIIRFERDAAQMIDEYMEWQLFNYKQTPTEQYVMLAVKIIPYKLLAQSNNNKAKSNVVFDGVFCNNLNKIYKETATAFKNVRSNPKKSYAGAWTYQSSLSLADFAHTQLKTLQLQGFTLQGKSIIKFEAYSSFENNKQAAEKLFTEIMKKVDACGNYTNRQLTKPLPGTVFIKYTIVFEGRELFVEISIADLGDGAAIVTAEVWDEAALFSKE